MKTKTSILRFPSVLMLAAGMLFASCNDEEVTPTPTPTPTPTNASIVSVKVNGTTMNSTSANVFTYYGNKITCRATLSSTKKVVLAFPPNATVGTTYSLAGTYDLSQSAPYPYMPCIALHEKYSSGGSLQDAEEGEMGSVTITFHDTSAKKLQGQFNFSSEDFSTGDMTNFTNGTFTIYY